MSGNIEQIDRVSERAQDAAQAAADATKDAVDRAADCAIRTVQRIQNHPIQVLVATLFTGILIGLCLRR
jgi:ElaB/YqjD/DUF883 family membrane-anchored ribosome-binding protein